jgi:hypothetical protein
VALTRDATSLVWSADVSKLMPTGGGTPSLMIVPGAAHNGGAPLDPGFRVTFSEAKLAVVSAPGTTAAASNDSVDFSSPDSASAYDPSTSGGAIAGIGAVTPTTAAPVTTTSSTIKQSETFAPPALAKGASPGRSSSHQPWARLLFLVPISAALGIASVYGRRLLAERGVVEA